MPKKTGKLIVDRECLGEALHTALRKCCDSSPTTLVWNLVHIMNDDIWSRYLDHVSLELEVADRAQAAQDKGNPTPLECWEALKSASLGFNKALENKLFGGRGHHPDADKIDWPSVHCLCLSFEFFDDNDWKGFAAFLKE
jgi:hypothetical protein